MTKNYNIPFHKLAIPFSVLLAIFPGMPLFNYNYSLGDTKAGVSDEEGFSSNLY